MDDKMTQLKKQSVTLLLHVGNSVLSARSDVVSSLSSELQCVVVVIAINKCQRIRFHKIILRRRFAIDRMEGYLKLGQRVALQGVLNSIFLKMISDHRILY